MNAAPRARAIVLALVVLSGSAAGSATGQPYALHSPNGLIKMRVEIGERITYDVTARDIRVLGPSPVSLRIDGEGERVLGEKPVVVEAKTREIRRTLHPVVPAKNREVIDHFNELALHCRGGYAVIFRAYDDGVAYRFTTALEGAVRVVSEEVVFNFSDDHTLHFPEEERLVTHQERLYKVVRLSEITPERFCSTPALVSIANGPKVLITEADLDDYPGLYLRGTGGNSLRGKFPAFVLESGMKRDRDPVIKKRADHLAETRGGRAFPWRVLVIAEEDADLLESELVFKLARPLALTDTAWIKPGKVAWDWYNALNLFGVDFRAGVNTRTYKHYIDFAAAHDIEYVILDEGWYPLGNLLDTVPDVDIPEIMAHARSKNVGVILWVVWKTLDDQLEPAMARFKHWGVSGIKVDFMQRDDQWMVNYYERIARVAAENKLLVDFHGAYKPCGLRRAYPNVLTREGVKGLENNKWSSDITPEHDVTLPFIRMVAGPMDYTPGSMVNAQKKNFKPVYTRPMSQGTRCHQLAMYVVYESPLQMLSDSPSHYRREKECLEFLSGVPVVWDETHALKGKVGDYIAVARRRGDRWWIGAMTDWTPRELTIDLEFLGRGNYRAEIYEDGPNADRYAEDYRKRTELVNSGKRLTVKLAPGGGWAAMLTPGPAR